MTFETKGFLSPDIEDWRREFVAANAKGFELANEVNTLAQTLAFNTSLKNNDQTAHQNLLALQLLSRSLSNFQGAVLMAERGMTIEARTLIRSCLESTFFLGALGNKEYDLIERMLRADVVDKKKLADTLHKTPDFLDIADEDMLASLDQMKQRAAAHPAAPKIQYEELSKKADMQGMYAIYRQLSGDSAHPTISSLKHYLDPAEKAIVSVVFGPDANVKEMAATMGLACNVIVGACVAFNVIAKDLDFDAKLREVFRKIVECWN